jgi:hypothetical protein
VCVVDSANNSLQCSPFKGESFTLPVSEADNYVCLSPDDAETLLVYLKEQCSK